jgi:sugar phosphate isomerase/epimerase
MKSQFSLAHLTTLGCTPAEMTYIARDAGYDFVSFRPIALGLPDEPRYPLGTDKAMLRQTKSALAETGLKLLDIEVARIVEGIDMRNYLPALEAAAELGGRHVLCSAWSKDRDFVVAEFGELCDLAAPLGLTVDFEFISFSHYSGLAQALDIVTASGRSNAGILVDTLHFDRSHTTLAALDAVPPNLLHYAQLCDAAAAVSPTPEDIIHTAREERLYLGEGDIDVRAIVQHMPPMPYSLEIANLKRVKEMGYAAFAKACLDTARRYLDGGQT